MSATQAGMVSQGVSVDREECVHRMLGRHTYIPGVAMCNPKETLRLAERWHAFSLGAMSSVMTAAPATPIMPPLLLHHWNPWPYQRHRIVTGSRGQPRRVSRVIFTLGQVMSESESVSCRI